VDLGLADRVFLVTGGTSGLGRATAEALVAEGARVVVIARTPEAVADAARAMGEHAVGLAGDLADPDLPDRAVRTALEAFGRLDGALLSTGGPPPGSVLTTTDEQWDRAWESVFLGTVRMMRAVVAGIRTSETCEGAALAVVLSTSATEVFPGLTASNGLRPGLAMLVKDLADEVGPEGIRVLGLLPGRIATGRLRALDEASGDPAAARARAQAVIPLRRYGTPEEFGRVAAFALSPAAGYLTGSLVRVDGGSTRSL
jgi:3-oxoacyl-[acyl-carrier protein] reductase